MAEKQNQNDENTPDWEFISLTASAYSASPGPHAPISQNTKSEEKTKLGSEKTKLDESSYGEKYEDFESDSSLFISRHFLLQKEKEFESSYEKDGSSESNKMKGIDDDELHKSLSHKMEERESVKTEEERESEDENEEEEKRESERNEEAREEENWIVSLYKRASERKNKFSFWKVFITAALVGVAIIGHKWRREKVQIERMKLHFLVNNERISCMVGPFDHISNQNYASMLDYASLA